MADGQFRPWFDRLLNIDRRWIYVLMALAVTIPAIWSFQTPVGLSGEVKAIYTLIDGLEETKFTLSVKNVLDEKYSEPGYDGFDIPATGRVGYLGVKQTF